MKIIISGAGEVGFHLAKQLSNEEHEITVIDINRDRLDKVDQAAELLVIEGSSTSFKTLKEAGTGEADLLVAVTSLESININTCILAKKLGAKKTIARVSSAEYVSADYTDTFHSLGIDHLIYPEELAAIEIVKLIERSAATDIIEFERGKLSLIGIRLDKKAPIIRKTLRQVAGEFQYFNFRIVAIQRAQRTIIPTGEDLFLPNDQIFAITTKNGLEEIIKLAGKEDYKIENIMILGGGKIGRKAAKLLETSVNVKLIENDKSKTMELAESLENSMVIQGDGRDFDLLAQESIIDMDAFIAVTNDSETNIITSLMAKHLGVEKTIAQVERADYIPLTQTIGLDSLINKKLIAANNLSRFIKKTSLLSSVSLQGVDAEVFEFIAKKGSGATKNKIRDLKIPKNAIIGGIIRGDKGIITVGDTQIEPDDKVLVFGLPKTESKVEKLFK